DANNSLHSFCHADGRWHLLGCILSAASCRRWWLDDILSGFDYDLDEEEVLGCDTGDTIFLPYLTGERSPHNDVDIRGAFINLGATTTRAQMSRAVMEGVAFALRDCMEIAKLSNERIIETTLCGGGAKSKAWRQILADILDTPIDIPETEQGPSYGAAILAMVGCGEYPSVDAACEKLIRTRERICPDRESVKRYEEKYRAFRKLYPLLKSLRE
ncbi:MAG: xylulokinase, partial [Eubacteriaceae bacterium]|nr:xylulokinase [Eubacteriaceae bacterium]